MLSLVQCRDLLNKNYESIKWYFTLQHILSSSHTITLRIHSRYSVVGEIALDQVFTVLSSNTPIVPGNVITPTSAGNVISCIAYQVTKLQFWRLACDTGCISRGAPRGQVNTVLIPLLHRTHPPWAQLEQIPNPANPVSHS